MRLFNSAQLTAQNHMKSVQLQHLLQDLTGHLEKKDHQGALQSIKAIKASSNLQPPILRMVQLFEVQCLLDLGQFAAAKLAYDELSKTALEQPKEETDPNMDAIYKQCAFLDAHVNKIFAAQAEKATQGRSGLEAELKSAGENKDLLYELALKAAEQEVFDIALDSLFSIIKREKGWKDKAAFKKYIEVLNNPKVDKALVKTHRLKLSNLVA